MRCAETEGRTSGQGWRRKAISSHRWQLWLSLRKRKRVLWATLFHNMATSPWEVCLKPANICSISRPTCRPESKLQLRCGFLVTWPSSERLAELLAANRRWQWSISLYFTTMAHPPVALVLPKTIELPPFLRDTNQTDLEFLTYCCCLPWWHDLLSCLLEPQISRLSFQYRISSPGWKKNANDPFQNAKRRNDVLKGTRQRLLLLYFY